MGRSAPSEREELSLCALRCGIVACSPLGCREEGFKLPHATNASAFLTDRFSDASGVKLGCVAQNHTEVRTESGGCVIGEGSAYGFIYFLRDNE